MCINNSVVFELFVFWADRKIEHAYLLTALLTAHVGGVKPCVPEIKWMHRILGNSFFHSAM